MRADRLVAILMLLQTRGRVTAAEVAAELEVSARTARRDLDALGVAGLPIYSRQGRNGGWELIGGGTTDLTGLTSAEARALFLVAGSAGVLSPTARAALRKLVRALPEPFRESAQAATDSVLVDPGGWDNQTRQLPTPALLDACQAIVVDGVQAVIGYVARDGKVTSRLVHPLGLACKGSTWYLIADTAAGLRTFRVDRATDVRATGDPVVRPPGFDLAAAWRDVSDEVERRRTPVEIQVLADEDMVSLSRYLFGTRVKIGGRASDGRVELALRGQSVRSLAGELAGLGAAVTVADSDAGSAGRDVRVLLAEIGQQLVTAYAIDQGSPVRP